MKFYFLFIFSLLVFSCKKEKSTPLHTSIELISFNTISNQNLLLCYRYKESEISKVFNISHYEPKLNPQKHTVREVVYFIQLDSEDYTVISSDELYHSKDERSVHEKLSNPRQLTPKICSLLDTAPTFLVRWTDANRDKIELCQGSFKKRKVLRSIDGKHQLHIDERYLIDREGHAVLDSYQEFKDMSMEVNWNVFPSSNHIKLTSDLSSCYLINEYLNNTKIEVYELNTMKKKTSTFKGKVLFFDVYKNNQYLVELVRSDNGSYENILYVNGKVQARLQYHEKFTVRDIVGFDRDRLQLYTKSMMLDFSGSEIVDYQRDIKDFLIKTIQSK